MKAKFIFIAVSPGMTATYTYRADGLRRAKTVNEAVT